MATDWDDEFSNSAYIAGGNEYPATWKEKATAFYESHGRVSADIAYGEHPRQKYDLFLPSVHPKGLTLFLHGGYWMDFDKSYWSHLARGLCARGWAVAIPNYLLAPEVRIAKITQMVANAVENCAERVGGPILLVGHSAGGHLVARMACENSPLPERVSRRLRKIVSISGVHDLRNLIQTGMNQVLQLNMDEAVAESPALQEPKPSVSVVCWVGELERPEFVRQATQLRDAWLGKLTSIQLVVEPDRHHFNVIESLEDSNGALVRTMDND